MSNVTHSEDWLVWLLSPSASAICLSLAVAIIIPILLHTYLYRQRIQRTSPSFLVTGPSQAGKTAFTNLLSTGRPCQTHISQTSSIIQCTLPHNLEFTSQGYRSASDPTVESDRTFALIDTPGHAKLRHFANDTLTSDGSSISHNSSHHTYKLRGLIFMLDSASISGDQSLIEAATYLHDLLLMIQKKRSKGSKNHEKFAVLIAANKEDLFTALPSSMVRKALEEEITKIRKTKGRGLQDLKAGGFEEEDEWLGETGDGEFKFEQMMEVDVEIEVLGGNVVEEGGKKVGKLDEWWRWIAEHI